MKDKYKGMTVNERLYSEGLIDDFYSAVEEKKIEKIIQILMNVDLDKFSIIEILKGLGFKDDDLSDEVMSQN